MITFIDYFSGIYGARWNTLYPALCQSDPKAARNCFGGFATYVMDHASIRAAEALQVSPGFQVLDLCAAPGGKTLILAEGLSGNGALIANELSSPRRVRLKEVLDMHIPSEFRSLVKITGFDGNQFGLKRKNEFDRVLLDAPCSSERHLIQDDPRVPDWKESRTRQLAMRQYSLLCAGMLALKPGGKLVYSTCSISPLENDGVIEKLISKKGDSYMLDPDTSDLQDLERTEFGFQIFPDRNQGAGPIYLSRIIKKD